MHVRLIVQMQLALLQNYCFRHAFMKVVCFGCSAYLLHYVLTVKMVELSTIDTPTHIIIHE